MSEERLQQLLKVVKPGSKVLILPHNDPDPDAITTAVALRFLLGETASAEVRIAFGGIVGRAENRALLRYLKYPLHPLTEADWTWAELLALVDTQPGAGNNLWRPGLPVAMVIDHHPARQESAQATFVDIRPNAGAASTILTQYLQAAGLKLPTFLATALFYGIKADTRGLSRGAGPADAMAYFYLQPQVDVEALAEIERAQVPAAYFKSFANTLEATQVYDGIAISYVGVMDYPDLTAEMADLLSRLEQVEWVICMGTYRSSLLLAVRVPGQHGDAGRLVQSVVGQDGTAGGHDTMAGGQIPLREGTPEELVARLKQRALDYLNVKPDLTGQPLV